MYLLVYAVLIIGLIGIYAQVLSLQAARIAGNMTGLANAMITWHSAAASMASGDIKNNPGLTVPCSLTYSLPAGLATRCDGFPGSGLGTVTTAGNALNDRANGDLVHLPSDFDASKVQFRSILYKDGTQYFVVTYVEPQTPSPSNPAPAYLELPPNFNLISYTMNDLAHQLSIVSLPDYAYGVALNTSTTSVLESIGNQRGGQISGGFTYTAFQYNLPLEGTTPIVPNKSIGIVSIPSNF